MAAYNKFNAFVEDLAEKVHNLGSDTLKILLTNTAPVAANSVKGDLVEITGGAFGYPTGGLTLVIASSAQSGGTYKLVGNDNTINATGAIGPFRYAALYNDTAASDNLIAWWDYGSAVTLANGDTFTFDFDGTNGVLQIV